MYLKIAYIILVSCRFKLILSLFLSPFKARDMQTRGKESSSTAMRNSNESKDWNLRGVLLVSLTLTASLYFLRKLHLLENHSKRLLVLPSIQTHLNQDTVPRHWMKKMWREGRRERGKMPKSKKDSKREEGRRTMGRIDFLRCKKSSVKKGKKSRREWR